MGSKLASIFSLLIFFYAALFIIDLTIVQTTYSALDSISSNICNIFSMKGGMSALDEVNDYIEKIDEYIELTIINKTSVVGETIDFKIEKQINSLFFANSIKKISIEKSALIGLYTGEII